MPSGRRWIARILLRRPVVSSTRERTRTRVTFMIDSLGHGGAEQTLGRIVPRLDQERFEPAVVVLQERQGNPIAFELERSGVRVDVVPVRRLRALSDHVGLVRYLARTRPDILHTHLEFSHSLGGIYGRMLGIPAVATVHTFAETRTSRDERRLPVMWWSLRRAHTKVIAPSAAGLRHFAEVGGVPRDKLVVMHNGVDLSEFRPRRNPRVRRELGIADDDLMIISIAVLRRGKGLGDLITATPRILDEIPSTRIVIVGDGDDRGRLEALTEDSGVADQVTFAGRREDVAELLAAGDLFVHPSHEDVLPTVIAEAMGSGLPTVASRVGGISEMVDDRSTGFLYPAGDIEALAAACVRVFEDEQPRAEMGQAARARAESVFDLDSQVRDLEVLYEQLSP